MSDPLFLLYHRHVAMASDRQLRFADFLQHHAPGAGYNYTISTGSLTFGDGLLRFEAHDLGSHAAPDNSWLWAWNNPHLALTPANQELARRARELGQRAGVPALLAEGPIDLGRLFGKELSEHAVHAFAAVVGGELGYDAYYRMPFEHGQAVALVRDERLRFAEALPLNRILNVFTQLIANLPVYHHRLAFVGYGQAYGLTVTEEGDRVVLSDGRGPELVGTFDHLARLTNLEGTVLPQGDGPASP